MSQLVIITGEIQKKSPLRHSKKNDNAVVISIMISEGSSDKLIPIRYYNDQARLIDQYINVGDNVKAQCIIRSKHIVKARKQAYIYYKLSLAGKKISLLTPKSNPGDNGEITSEYLRQKIRQLLIKKIGNNNN